MQASSRQHENNHQSEYRWRINLERAQILKEALGEVGQHWIDAAAAAYVESQQLESNKNDTNDIFRELTVDEGIKERFELACQMLYVDQDNAKGNEPVRSNLPKELQLILNSRPDLRRLQPDKTEQNKSFANGF